MLAAWQGWGPRGRAGWERFPSNRPPYIIRAPRHDSRGRGRRRGGERQGAKRLRLSRGSSPLCMSASSRVRQLPHPPADRSRVADSADLNSPVPGPPWRGRVGRTLGEPLRQRGPRHRRRLPWARSPSAPSRSLRALLSASHQTRAAPTVMGKVVWSREEGTCSLESGLGAALGNGVWPVPAALPVEAAPAPGRCLAHTDGPPAQGCCF